MQSWFSKICKKNFYSFNLPIMHIRFKQVLLIFDLRPIHNKFSAIFFYSCSKMKRVSLHVTQVPVDGRYKSDQNTKFM